MAIVRTYTTTTKEISSGQIWQLMSNVNHWADWDQGLESTSLAGEFKAGNVIMLKPKGGPKVKVELLDVRPTSYFKDVTRFPLAQMYDEHWYEDTPEGLKITSTLTMRGPLAFLWNKIVMQKMADHIAEDIANQISEAKKL